MKAFKSLALAAALAITFSGSASAALFISEVHPSGSGTLTYAADWFELTNTGAAAVDITGWKMDDNSNSFAAAAALRGVTSIGAGKSIVFFEGNTTGTTDATITSNFNAAWGTSFVFGTSIGAYGGSGVGLSTGGDAVNLFDSSGTRITGVAFGPATAGVTFNNAAGIGGATLPLPTISTLSVAGIDGAFSSGTEIGSPGAIAAVPEPETYAMLLAGLAVIGGIARRRKAV